MSDQEQLAAIREAVTHLGPTWAYLEMLKILGLPDRRFAAAPVVTETAGVSPTNWQQIAEAYARGVVLPPSDGGAARDVLVRAFLGGAFTALRMTAQDLREENSSLRIRLGH